MSDVGNQECAGCGQSHHELGVDWGIDWERECTAGEFPSKMFDQQHAPFYKARRLEISRVRKMLEVAAF